MTMASKKPKAAPTDDELNQLLEGIADEPKAAGTTKGGASGKGVKSGKSQSEQQLLAELDELENLGAPQPTSRPHTPRLQAGRRAGATPVGSTRTSEERAAGARKSGESARSGHTTTLTPSATSSDVQDAEKRDVERRGSERGDVEKTPVAEGAEATPSSGGGGWWGGLFATASAAVKTAEAAVKEIQSNEEAMRWAEQVKGNVGALRGLGMMISPKRDT